MIKSNVLLILLLMFTFFIYTVSPVSAEVEVPDIQNGSPNPIVVTVSDSRADSEYPFSLQEISSDELGDYLYGQEPSFILTRTPSMTSYSEAGSFQGYSYFRLRGIDQTRINMTLDGVPLNEPEDQGVYFSNYSGLLDSISRIQIQRGVGTSNNGSASYAGSILFDSFNLNEPTNREVGVSAGSYGSYRAYAEFNSGLNDSKGLYLRATHLHSDGYKHHSDNTSESLFYKGGIFDPKDTWLVSGFVGTQENDLAWLGSSLEEIENDRKHNANSDEDDEFLQGLIQLQNIHTFDSDDALKTSIYYNHLEGNYDFDLNNFLGLPSTDELFNYHLNSNLFGGFSNYEINFNTTKFTLGVHGNHYEREHLGRERQIGKIYENTGTKNEVSSFAKVEYTFGKLLFLSDLQVRYTDFSYDGDVPLANLDWEFFNPKIGVTYLISEFTNVYYSIGKTGREPTRNDIFDGNDNLLADENGNPIIGTTSAEYVIDQELGLRTRGENWSFSGNGYYMDFDNEIVLNGELGPNALALTNNVDKSFRSGIEVIFDWNVNETIKLGTNASYNYSQVEEGDAEFTPIVTPRWILNQNIEYNKGSWSLGLDLRYQSESYIDFANSETLDEYFVTDLSAHYRYSDMLLGLHINNLFDNDYFSNGYVDPNGTAKYYVQAPANFYVTLTWNY